MTVQQALGFSGPSGKFCVNISGKFLVQLPQIKIVFWHFLSLKAHMGTPQFYRGVQEITALQGLSK